MTYNQEVYELFNKLNDILNVDIKNSDDVTLSLIEQNIEKLQKIKRQIILHDENNNYKKIDKYYHCKCCDYKTKNICKFKNHIEKKSRNTPHDNIYLVKYKLKSESYIYKNGKYICKECEGSRFKNSFKSFGSFKTHMRGHLHPDDFDRIFTR